VDDTAPIQNDNAQLCVWEGDEDYHCLIEIGFRPTGSSGSNCPIDPDSVVVAACHSDGSSKSTKNIDINIFESPCYHDGDQLCFKKPKAPKSSNGDGGRTYTVEYSVNAGDGATGGATWTREVFFPFEDGGCQTSLAANRHTRVLHKEAGGPNGSSETKKNRSHPGKMPARGSVGKEPNGSSKRENRRVRGPVGLS
jgi:hypothetical protein